MAEEPARRETGREPDGREPPSPRRGLREGPGRPAAVSGFHDPPIPFLAAIGRMSLPMAVSDPGLPDNPIIFVNDAFLDLTGYEGHELVGRNCRLLQGPGTDPATLDGVRRAIAEEREHTAEILNYRKDGSPFWNQLFISPMRGEDGRLTHFLSSQTDVTRVREADRVEAALRRSEASARLAVDAGRMGTWDYDPISGVLAWDTRHRALFGLPPDAGVTYETFLGGCHPDDRARVHAAVTAALDPAGMGKIAEDFRAVGPSPPWGDGVERWLSTSGRAFFADGRCTRFIGVIADITERKRTEEALLRLNGGLEMLVEERTRDRDRIWRLSRDLMLVARPDGVVTALNPAWGAALGRDPETLVGTPLAELLRPDHSAGPVEGVPQPARGPIGDGIRSRLCHHDGTWRWFAWTAVSDAGRLYAVGRDVTAEREAAEALHRAEEQLRQAQKMEAVGQFTGGVAHDFNNLLQVVMGNLEVLQRNLPTGADRLQRSADNAMRAARRAAVLTQRLLAFSRRQPLAPRPTDANALVVGMSDLLARTLGETVRIETVLADGLWRVEADPNQLENALLNLAVNARDAMPDGGHLTVETANASLDGAYAARMPDATPGHHVVISVSDTGLGMDADTLGRVFEPFFTTKPVGQGTGLGLSQVYGFVRQSGGHVTLGSAPGEGTTVRIHLPRLLAGEGTEEAPCTTSAPEASGAKSVLVVEDEDAVRAHSVSVLRELGYRVLEAGDGPTALGLLGCEAGAVDLLFSDVVLPGGMTGAELARRAVTLRPGLRVLFTTGYARDAIVHQGRLDPGVRLITKPFTYADLAARVREVLDAPPPQP